MSTITIILNVLESVLASCFIHFVVTCIAETVAVVVSMVHGYTVECTTNAAGNLMLLVADLNDLTVKIVGAQSTALALTGSLIAILGYFVIVTIAASNGMSTVAVVLNALEAVLASFLVHLIVTSIAETVAVVVSMVHGYTVECTTNAAGNLMLLVADLNDLTVKIVGAQSTALALTGSLIAILGYFVIVTIAASNGMSTVAVVLNALIAVLASFLRCCATDLTFTICTESARNSIGINLTTFACGLMCTVVIRGNYVPLVNMVNVTTALVTFTVLGISVFTSHCNGKACGRLTTNTTTKLVCTISERNVHINIACMLCIFCEGTDGHQADNQNDYQQQCQKLLLHWFF